MRKRREGSESRMTGVVGYDESGIPIIRCDLVGKFFQFYCSECRRFHSHSAGDGHRTSHCDSDNYPKGYILKGPNNFALEK